MNFKKNLALPILLTVILVGGLVLFASRKAIVSQVSPSPTTNSDSEVVEEVKDGMYINHTYGFKFDYLPEVFTANSSWDRDGNRRFFSVANENPPYSPSLSVYLAPTDFTNNRRSYDNCYSTANGQVIKKLNINPNLEEGVITKKLYNLGKVCVKVTTPDRPGDFIDGQGYALSVPNIKDDRIISISLSTSTLKDLYNLRTKFDRLAKSFEFLSN